MGFTLKQLIDALAEEGVVGDEAEEAVEKFLEARRAKRAGVSGTSALAKRAPSEIDFPSSPQSDPAMARRAVNYGDETAQEAKARWLRQEAADPDGIFAGGATAGGIFGDAAIATETYDPGARHRNAQLENLELARQEKVITLQVMQRMAARLGVSVDDIKAELGGSGVPALPGRHRR